VETVTNLIGSAETGGDEAILAGYVSPVGVRRRPPDPAAATVVEFTLLSGKGFRFAKVREARLQSVLRFKPASTYNDLLRGVLDAYGFDDLAHLAELKFLRSRRRYRLDRCTGAPWFPLGGYLTCGDDGRFETPQGWVDGSELGVGELFGQGDVGYLVFDLSVRWSWRVRAIGSCPEVPVQNGSEPPVGESPLADSSYPLSGRLASECTPNCMVLRHPELVVLQHAYPSDPFLIEHSLVSFDTPR
jgi:hypothetical protein